MAGRGDLSRFSNMRLQDRRPRWAGLRIILIRDELHLTPFPALTPDLSFGSNLNYLLALRAGLLAA